MKKIGLLKFIFLACLLALAANDTEAQTERQQQPAPKKVNFAYSQNPKTKTKSETNRMKTAAPEQTPAADADGTKPNRELESRSIAGKTLEIAKRANNIAAPTEIYKIGTGDVLYISLQNAPAKNSTYFTVLNDGTIDYPLAGEMVAVGGLTVEEVEDLLKEKVKLYENPQISVKIREHASHKITVLGLVEKAGEKFLQREAIPLYIVRAEAIAQPKANFAVIKRAAASTETIDLKDPKSEDVLIFPGDIIEFKSDDFSASESSAPQFYYIGGNVASAGQKDFHQGLTLTQAILASGGLKKATVKKIVVRRKNQAGLLSPLEFNLDSIKAGKQPDPILRAGDTIEIVN